MKQICIFLFIAVVVSSCSKDIGETVQSNEPNKEILAKPGQPNLWPTDPGFFNALHAPDRMRTLAYYQDDNNFTVYTDPNQKVFAQSILMGKLTYDVGFLQSNLAISEYLLKDIFDKNLPCQACIVRIIKAAESNNTILQSKIPSILNNNKPKISDYIVDLAEVREDDCDCPEGAENNVGVPNFEETVYRYINE